MNIGILATGTMAHTFAKTVVQMQDEVKCIAVASRDLNKAKKFAEEFGIERAYGSYMELIQDPDVDLVYIATPHSRHAEDMKSCIMNHKPVLCEKAFTVNAKQAREIKELAQKEHVFVSEAIWVRYMPSHYLIQQVLNSGIIGKPYLLTANLSYIIAQNKRIVDPNLAGGALLDVGVYGLNFSLMHFGNDIERIESSVQMTESGVDGQESITIFFKDGKMAVLSHGIYARGDRKGIIYGDKGYMIVENINNPSEISVYDTNDQLLRRLPVPQQISGYEYEIRECADCLQKGDIESRSMPLDESIFVMEQMDRLRSQWKLVYPFEQ